MWYIKCTLKHHGCIYTPKTKEYGVIDYTYPLGHTRRGKDVYLSAIHIIHGPPAQIKKYISYLKAHPDILRAEGSGNILFTYVHEFTYPQEYRAVYNPELIYIAPIINDKDGYETWQLASWNRKPLADLISLSKKLKILIYFKLHQFQKKSIHDAYIVNLLPKLPPKQAAALRTAYEHGYYEFPKKTNLKELAKAMQISKPTFQEHLRRAENKVIPFLLDNQKHT